jgi:hypothetical protein
VLAGGRAVAANALSGVARGDFLRLEEWTLFAEDEWYIGLRSDFRPCHQNVQRYECLCTTGQGWVGGSNVVFAWARHNMDVLDQ